MISCNEKLLQQLTSEFLQWAFSATSKEQVLQRVTIECLQRVMSEFLQRAISATSIGKMLQQVTSDFLQRSTTATSYERI